MAFRLFASDDGSVMMEVSIGLFYCSQDELAAVRRHVPLSMTVTLYADDGADIVCDFVIVGSSAVKRRAVVAALQKRLGGTPALLLFASPNDDPALMGDFAVLAHSEMYLLPYVITRELRLHHSELALRESEGRYRELLESANEGVWVIDHEGATSFANGRMAELLGVNVEMLQRQSFFDFVDPQQRAFALTKLQGAGHRRGQPHELRFRREDGSLFWAAVSLSAVRDSRGEPAGTMAVVTDIDARREMEEALRRRDMQLDIAQQLAQIESWEWDIDNDVLSLADRFQRVDARDRARLIARAHRAAEDGTIFDEEFRLMLDGGTERIMHARGQVVPGHPRRMIGVAQDVTQRRNDELRYRTILSNVPDVIWRDDLKGRLSYISENIVDLWGYTAEEVMEEGVNLWSQRVHPEDGERCLAAYEAMFQEGKPYDVEYRFLRRDGQWIWIHNRAEIAEIGTQRHAFGVMSDVTERHRAMDELARSEAQYRAVFEQANAIIYTVDPQGRFTSLNPVFESLTGWKAGEWIGRPFAELFDESEGDAAVAHFNAVLAGERMARDYHLRTNEGVELIIETSPEALRSNGEVIGAVGIARDVTRRRKTDREFEKEKRLASLGQLAASVAHEFNNVLMSILPFAELLKRRAPQDPKVDTATRHIFQAIRRGRQVSQEIQRLARPVSSASLVTIDVPKWISDFAREAQATLGVSYVVETQSREPDLYARGDLSLLTQVATNLVVNARDAMANGGRLMIEACRNASDQVEIAITDSGDGIPETIVDRIFDPLFTTKRSGTGLGLSIAHQAMVQQEGALRVRSRVGEGSTFTIVLPAALPPEKEEEDEPPSQHALRRIVLVEDDESVGEGIRALLVDEGFDVHLVTKGGEAVGAVRTFDPELVLLDVNLPDMSGLDVYEELAKRWPDLPVIFSTGHADARALDEVRRRDVPSIMKPYDFDELMAMMARVRG